MERKKTYNHEVPFVLKENWGKDHFSLLAYLYTIYGDGSGSAGVIVPVFDRMTINETTHPWQYGQKRHTMSCVDDGVFRYSSRLRGIEVPEHDEVDSLHDLENEGFIKVMSWNDCSLIITEQGLELAQQIMKHKAEGGNFAQFDLPGNLMTARMVEIKEVSDRI